jgi:hypothetical protein
MIATKPSGYMEAAVNAPKVNSATLRTKATANKEKILIPWRIEGKCPMNANFTRVHAEIH